MKLWRCWFSFYVIFFVCLNAYAQISVDIEPKNPMVSQTIRLILNLGDKNLALPDLQALQKDFKVVGTEHSINQYMIQGQFQAQYSYIIYLSPRREGTLIIPPLQVGTFSTKALSIKVLADTSPLNQALPDDSQLSPSRAAPILIKADVASKGDTYINQQILYTVKLYTKSQIIDSEYRPPAVENALILPLGETISTQEKVKGDTYQVSIQKYLIFPQKSGNLEIDAPSFTAIVYDVPPKRVSVEAPRLSLSVKPVPKGHQFWLPAKHLTLSVKDENEEKPLHVGDTLTRIVTLKARGVPAQLLPKLTFAKPHGASVYQEKPQNDNTISYDDWMGEVQYRVNYLVNEEGMLVIPALNIKWFNTQKNQDEIATLPEKSYSIVGTTKKPELPIKPMPLGDVKPAAQAVTPIHTFSFKALFLNLHVIQLGVILALIGFILAYLKTWFKHIELSVAKKEFKKACRSNDVHRIKTTFLKWLSLRYPQKNSTSLQALMDEIKDASMKAMLLSLQHEVYGESKAHSDFEGLVFYKKWVKFRFKSFKTLKKGTALAPFNPD